MNKIQQFKRSLYVENPKSRRHILRWERVFSLLFLHGKGDFNFKTFEICVCLCVFVLSFVMCLKQESQAGISLCQSVMCVRDQITLGAEHVTYQGPDVPSNRSRCCSKPVSHCQVVFKWRSACGRLSSFHGNPGF